MKIERLIEEGLLLGGQGMADMDDIAAGDRESMHMHGQAIRASATDDEQERHHPHTQDRHSSLIEELRRQSGVFFDDSDVDGEETGGSEDETANEKMMEMKDGN